MGQRRRVLRVVDLSTFPGLQSLLDAWEYARDVAIDPWQFAVEIQALRATGVSNNALRWLIVRAFVQHGAETSRSTGRRRSFRKNNSLSLSNRDCFVLTEMGYSNCKRSNAIIDSVGTF